MPSVTAARLQIIAQGAGHGALPRLWRGRARPRLAPTGVRRSIPGRATVRHGSPQPPCRGQALPDPSGPPGPADHRGHPSAVGRDHRRMAGWDAHVPRRPARAGEAAPRPYNVGRFIPGRALVSDGGARPPPCRGQALPDPPARQGRQTTGGAMVTMPAGPSDRAMHATDCRAWWRGRARRRLAPTTWRGAFPVGHMDTTGGAAPAL
jgi:hypothetical protein